MNMQALVLAFLAAAFGQAAALSKRQASSGGKCPSLFAAVLTKGDNNELRAGIREMWREAGSDWGDVKAKFLMCGLASNVSKAVQHEINLHGDIVLMDCEEGYLNGILTKKVAESMRTYLAHYSDYELYMKIDDDTFASMRRLCTMLQWRAEHNKSLANIYAGVFAEGPNETILTKHTPDRDITSAWYEPPEIFPDEVYPSSAKGGPGYILSKPLVEGILSNGIAERLNLNNEDKAVGVWVDKLIKDYNFEIDLLNLPGTDGYDEHAASIVTTGAYKSYPHFFHHHINGPTISCLASVDNSLNPELFVDDCFTSPENTSFGSKTWHFP
jgi:hypothetical protein